MLQKLLGITTIDIFVLSSFLSSSPSVTKTWKTLEGYYRQGIIHQLGVSDYSEQQLKASLENPEFAVKPAVNQVNYTFCDIPDSLKTMAAQNKVDLLYTLDSKGRVEWGVGKGIQLTSFLEILSRQELTALSRENGLIQANRSISPRWVLKYDVFDKARSVVTDKGYIIVGDVE
jgi:diketogulonate reductase-like aldo/keto reductase